LGVLRILRIHLLVVNHFDFGLLIDELILLLQNTLSLLGRLRVALIVHLLVDQKLLL